MNEDPAQQRLIELVIALRPSIARRCGVDVDGVDVVTDPGLAAWTVAMRQLAADLSQGPAYDWAMSELSAEPGRWRDGAVVLSLAARWLANSGRGRAKGAEQTVANVAALRARVGSGRATLTDADIQRADVTRAACGRTHRSLAIELDRLVNLTPSLPLPWPCAPAAIPLVTTAGVRALRPLFASDRPLPLAQPRVAS